MSDVFSSDLWALGEVGRDWWQLGTRGGLLVLLGLWLLTPWTTRQPSGWEIGRSALAVAVLASLAVAGAAMLRDPHDIAGRLDQQPTTAEPRLGDVPPGELIGRPPGRE